MDGIERDGNELVLKTPEFIRLAKVSRTTFYQWKKAGRLTGLESSAPGRWSRRKVEAWLSGQSFTDRRRTPRVA